MSYQRYYTTWKDWPDVTTPVTSAFYQALEDFLVNVISITDGGALPTADPHVVGKLWNNAGVVTVSAG